MSKEFEVPALHNQLAEDPDVLKCISEACKIDTDYVEIHIQQVNIYIERKYKSENP